ncbi:MAG: hypothetical protein V1717_04245 [Candidatus Micrarchaeota archaeon]
MDSVVNAFLAIILLAVVFEAIAITDAAILLIGGFLFFKPLDLIDSAY